MSAANACDECGAIHGPGNTNTLCPLASNYEPPDIDCVATDEVVCPYCGNEHSESYEFFEGNRDDTEVTCTECERDFRASRDVSVSYSSRVKP
jgi:uncharacterized Zn-finger protein